MRKIHRILLAAAGGILLVAVGWLWMAAELGVHAIWGSIPALLGLLLVSYAIFQVHEGLMALFWSVLFFLAALAYPNIWEPNMVFTATMLILGVWLLVLGIHILLKKQGVEQGK